MGYVSTGKDLETMRHEVRALNLAKGWRNPEITFPEYVALAHSELSEALEAFRDWRLADATALEGKPEGVGAELADVLVRIIDMADIFDIDLDFEYRRKMAHSWTRPFQHGGRTIR